MNQELIDGWKAKRKTGDEDVSKDTKEEEDIYGGSGLETRLSDDSDTETEANKVINTADGPKQFISHVPVPSQQDIEQAIVRRKKMELLQKYASESLRAEAEEAKTLLGL